MGGSGDGVVGGWRWAVDWERERGVEGRGGGIFKDDGYGGVR